MALSMVLDVATDTSSNVLSDDFSRLLARYLLRELNANVSLFRQEHLFCNKAIDKDTPVMNSLTHGNRCCDLRFHMILLRSSMRHISFKTNALNIGLPALFDREWDLFLDYEAHKGERGTEDMFEVLLGMFCNFFNGTNTGEFNTTFIDRISRIAIGEEKRSFSIKSISIAYMILKSLFNMNKPSSTKTSISFKSFCAKVILLAFCYPTFAGSRNKNRCTYTIFDHIHFHIDIIDDKRNEVEDTNQCERQMQIYLFFGLFSLYNSLWRREASSLIKPLEQAQLLP